MNNENNYLIFSMSRYGEWQKGVENRNYHIVNCLRKRTDTNKILLVEYLPLTLKQCFKNFIYALKLEGQGKIINRNLFSQLTKIDDKLYVLSVYNKPNAKLWDYLNDYIKTQFADEYYLWSYIPTYTEYIENLTEAKAKVFDTVDDWSKHSSYKKIVDKLESNYQYINNNFDYIFTVSPYLEKKFSRSEKVYFIPNGVDFNHFQQREKIINRDIAKLSKPVIGYIGTIQDRFNVEIIKEIVEKIPKASVVLVGPIWYAKLKSELSSIKNVYCLGAKSYQEAPMYIQQFDVGIIPNHFDDFEKTTDPMKIYNYLACGKPVVASYLPANESLHPYIKVGSDPASFAEAIIQVYADNDKEQYLERLSFAKEQSWNNRLQQMLNIVFSDKHHHQIL